MDVAKEALNEIRGHTRECDIRYRSIEDSNGRIEAALTALAAKQTTDNGALYKLLWGVSFAVTGGMFAVIMALVFKH